MRHSGRHLDRHSGRQLVTLRMGPVVTHPKMNAAVTPLLRELRQLLPVCVGSTGSAGQMSSLFQLSQGGHASGTTSGVPPDINKMYNVHPKLTRHFTGPLPSETMSSLIMSTPQT